MKAFLAFTLPEEADEHLTALQGAEWRGVVGALDETLRNKLKYEKLSAAARRVLEKERELLRMEVEGRGLSLEY